MRSSLSAFAMLCAAAPAIAQRPPGPPAEPLRIVLPVIEPGCGAPAPGDDVILVCGKEDKRYRIDPTVLAVARARDALNNSRRPDAYRGLLKGETCGPVGGRPCAGQNTLPVSNIALTVTTALIKLVKGEDIRPMLRQGPSDYDLHKQETSEAARREAPVPAPPPVP